MDSVLPVCMIHIGYKEYVKTNLLITGKTNRVFLLGDPSLSSLGDLPNVTFVNVLPYFAKERCVTYKQAFRNYSSNSAELEFLCFARIFILLDFLQEYGLSRIFHIDSDNVLLRDVNMYPFQNEEAYIRNTNFHKMRMSNSIHCGLLTIDYCKRFEKLYQDIFMNGSKFFLLENKIRFHRDAAGKFVNGGICDMTFYYLLAEERKVQNLASPVDISGSDYVWLNNLNGGEGLESKTQYATENGLTKIVDGCVFDIIHNRSYRLFNIHFQGAAKSLLNPVFCKPYIENSA